MLKAILIIGSGSFIGGVSRFLTAKYVHNNFLSNFPYGTLLVNIIGCFLVGLIFGMAERGHLTHPEWRLFLVVGFCGGFTTFSAFSEENLNMLSGGNMLHFSMNVGLNVFAGIMAVFLGSNLVRLF